MKGLKDNTIIVIGGATASGKSDFAVRLAELLDTEIISCDALQLYKYMDVGTAKPTKEQLAHVKHHMVDVILPDTPYSVAEYQKQAMAIADQLLSRGKTPVFVGGTGLFISSIVYNMSFTQTQRNDDLRATLQKIMAQKGGADYLYTLLRLLDEDLAKTVHKNNTVRVIRTLEILLQEGTKPTDQEVLRTDYNVILLSLDCDRALLYDRINARVDIMLQDGLEKEVKELLAQGYSFDLQAFQAIGYKEWQPYFEGNATLQEVSERIKQGTRNYAKRQITWLKRYSFAHHINREQVLKLNDTQLLEYLISLQTT